MYKIQTIAIVTSLSLFLIVLELVRRRLLKEQYSLLWIICSIILLILSLWRNLLDILASWIGIFYAPSLLFLIAFTFLLLIVLHFSIAISKLSEQNKRLTQEMGLLKLLLENFEKKNENE